MEEKAIVQLVDEKNEFTTELEIPLDITANDLIVALNEALHLGMDTENIFNCYLVAESPVAFLRGNKLLSDFGICNGSRIMFKRS